ncbi:hypothetical protein O3P69_014165 [Scylla paramamosain]|uniref:Uncharacterized protein n=1 Tax=Scylla paramamosain TaxID=85552 RepID=A0AAW0SEQ5_SCYPA
MPTCSPLGGCSALRLAVTTDRARTVSLLLASGAFLSATLLQEAWQSPNVTHRVLASLTSAYCCRLRVERRRLVEVSRAHVEGISNLLEDIEGSTPWLAAWRSGEDTDHATLSDLLAKAAAANCPVTAAFLQSAGAWPFFSQASGGSALHAALDAGHQTMAEALIRDLGGCPYVPDTHGRLPVHMMSDEERQRLEQRLFEEEQEKLKDLELRQKADREKAAARTALDVQKPHFTCLLIHRPPLFHNLRLPPHSSLATLCPSTPSVNHRGRHQEPGPKLECYKWGEFEEQQ